MESELGFQTGFVAHEQPLAAVELSVHLLSEELTASRVQYSIGYHYRFASALRTVCVECTTPQKLDSLGGVC